MFKFKQLKRRIARLVVILGFAALITAQVGFTPTQQAYAADTTMTSTQSTSSDEPPPPSCDDVTVGEGTGDCADIDESASHSHSSVKVKVVDVNGVKLHSGVTVLANIKANGTPKSQQTDCYRIPRSMSIWTSYNAMGTTGWHWKTYPKGYRFCRINGAVRDPKCHNMVKIGVPRSHPPKNAITGEVKFVQRLKWHVKAVAKADVRATSVAKAWCNTSSASAYGEGRGSSSARAIGRASLRGSILVKVSAQVEAMANGDLEAHLGGMTVIDVNAQVRASAVAKATSDAKAKAECSDTPPPPVYDQPRVDVGPVACVNPGESRDVTVTVSNPNDIADTARLTYRGEQKPDKAVAANGQVAFTFANQAAGTYNGSVLLVTAGKSKSFVVTVEECVLQPGSIVEVEDVNDVLYGNTRTWRIRGVVPDGQTATLRVSAQIGTVRESDKTIALGAGAFDVTVVYTAPTEGSSDTLTARLFGSDGVKDDEKSDTFQLRPNPVDPPRPAPVGRIGGPQST